jgi:hypothetical protein
VLIADMKDIKKGKRKKEMEDIVKVSKKVVEEKKKGRKILRIY